MNEADAAVLTATATRELVYATWALAILTLILAVIAVVLPHVQRRRDNNDKKERQADLDGQAESAIQNTVTLLEEVRSELEKLTPYNQFSLWALANRIHTQSRVVEYFFDPGSVSAAIPYRLSACLQALAEAADGVEQAIDKGGADDPIHRAAVRANGAATTKRALERLGKALAAAKITPPTKTQVRNSAGC
jgi:enamine deaminase RidA (YjgF/YER057c/UK114 family)